MHFPPFSDLHSQGHCWHPGWSQIVCGLMLRREVLVEQQVSKCGPQTSIISITWNLIKNANSWAHLTDESKTL